MQCWCYFLQVAELQDKLTAAETEIAELKNKMDDLEYYHGCASQQVDKLDRHLNDALQKLKSFEDTTVVHDGSGKGVTGVAKSKVIIINWHKSPLWTLFVSPFLTHLLIFLF